MDSIDYKGIAWVGHIYQKFEAMCLEVEEAMSQETAKYVENQVQTVGAGMKRFCSDVMQDLLPPSSKDLSRVASSDLLLNPYLEFGIHKKPISNIKEDEVININPVSLKAISENKLKSNNDVWEDWSAASFNWEISDKDEESCDPMPRQASNETLVMAVITKSSAKVVNRARRISSSNILRTEHKGTCGFSGLVSQVGSQATSKKSTSLSIEGDVSQTDACENSKQTSLSQIGPTVNANTKCDQSIGDEVFMPHSGSSADRDPNLVEETKNDVGMQITESVGHEFEETCVLVDGNDYCPDNRKEEVRRSYKKKIQNTFSLKKKSAREQEYKHLAVQCSISNAETNIECDEANPLSRTLAKNIEANKLATHDSLESEWELL